MKNIAVFIALISCGVRIYATHPCCYLEREIPDQFNNCGGERYAGLSFSTRSPVIAPHGVAASSLPLSTEVMLDVLKSGGNAVDAAIAGNAIQTLMEPHNNGLGGDLFAMVWDPITKQLYGLNGSGRSYKSFSYENMEDLLDGAQFIPDFGPLSTSIPGTADAWAELTNRFGTKSLAELLEPTIFYAEKGFPVPEVVSAEWATSEAFLTSPELRQIVTSNGRYPNAQDGWEAIYRPDGRTKTHGEIFRNPTYANALRLLSEGGRDAFYRGEIAEELVRWGNSVGIHWDLEDFSSHTSTWVEPMSTNYRGWDIFELPPNGQGITVLQMLNILEGFNLTAMGHNSADYIHAHVEAKKLAFADRAKFYADPEFNDLDYAPLLHKEYAAERRQLIDMEQAKMVVDGGFPKLEKGDTIYISVADENGMMVSLIQSNFDNFGSGLVPDNLGFAIQNRGSLFSMNRDDYNSYETFKRPFHTIIPAFVMEEGEPLMSFGVMGGAIQPQGHCQIICNLLDFGMGLQEAGDAARYRHALSSQPTGYVMTDGGVLGLEGGICEETREELIRRGHTIGDAGAMGGYQAVMWDKQNKVWWSASEMRKDGHAAGY